MHVCQHMAGGDTVKRL